LGIDGSLIDDVIFAESSLTGGAIARHAAVACGILQSGGMAVNRHCAGSHASTSIAAAQIASEWSA
jgi:acetyl-CoA C-acetyltransferase